MSTIYIRLAITFLTTTMTFPTFASITLGNPESDLGAVTLSGTLRGNYQHKDYAQDVSDQKIQFDTGILTLDYQSPDWFGKVEYRCYQYDHLCDFSTLVDAYMGYQLNDTDQVTFGLQPIPFGVGRFWDSSFYAGINNTMGLQDAHNIGVNYHFQLPSSTQFDLAYFVKDGGNYHGNSRDSARYTANMVQSSDPEQTSLVEKNMWMGRVQHDLFFLNNHDDDHALKMSVGGSYWYSEIENNNNAEKGSRHAWALFNTLSYQDFSLSVTGGKLSIDNQDILSPLSSTFGSFDTEYQLANEGYFYTLDTHYKFKNVRDHFNITPYVVYSGYAKKDKSLSDSKRHIAGVAWNYKNSTLYTEYVMSQNDPFVGGTANALAQGDNVRWNKLLNLTLVYNF